MLGCAGPTSIDDMGFRFRQSIRLFPGVRLNFSKTGTSVSIGGKGATTNISNRGVRNTVSLPGTGLSYSTFTPSGKSSNLAPVNSRPAIAPAPLPAQRTLPGEWRKRAITVIGATSALILLYLLISN